MAASSLMPIGWRLGSAVWWERTRNRYTVIAVTISVYHLTESWVIIKFAGPMQMSKKRVRKLKDGSTPAGNVFARQN